MFDCEAEFVAATDLWYQRTVEVAQDLRHPQSLVETFGRPVVAPQRRSVYEPHAKTRIRSRFREVRRGRQSRRVLTFAESELIQYAVRDRSVTAETEAKVKKLMQAPLREVDCDIAKRFEGVTLTEPLAQVRAAMDGWCVQKMPWNMKMKAMAVLDAADRVELDFSNNAKFLRCLIRTSQSKTYGERFAFYLKFTERLDENMEMVFRLARSEIGVLCLVTGIIAEFSPISCVVFDPMLDELEMFSGDVGDKGLMEYTHWVLHYFESIMMWEKKLQLAKEMKDAIDPNYGAGELQTMRKEIARMELRLKQIKKQQGVIIQEMEFALKRRETIATRGAVQKRLNKDRTRADIAQAGQQDAGGHRRTTGA